MGIILDRRIAGFASGAGVAILLAFSPLQAKAQQYEFAPPSHIKLNRVYKVDRISGEVTACQYGVKDGAIGVTLCYPAGEGATSQAPGDYGLVASHHVDDGGIFRVNKRSGDMSVCFVLDNEQVVCTPQASAEPMTASVPADKPKTPAAEAPATPGGP